MRSPALFLDRDGVINIDYGYIYRIEDFEFIEGIFELCKAAQDLRYKIIIITNQSGIARGYYSEHDFHKLSKWMLNVFSSKSINITDIYFCPYHPKYGKSKYRKDAHCRKPNPGMIINAALDHNLDLHKSILVGDQLSDIEAGIAAKVAKNILLSYKGISDANVLSISNLQEIIPML